MGAEVPLVGGDAGDDLRARRVAQQGEPGGVAAVLGDVVVHPRHRGGDVLVVRGVADRVRARGIGEAVIDAHQHVPGVVRAASPCRASGCPCRRCATRRRGPRSRPAPGNRAPAGTRRGRPAPGRRPGRPRRRGPSPGRARRGTRSTVPARRSRRHAPTMPTGVRSRSRRRRSPRAAPPVPARRPGRRRDAAEEGFRSTPRLHHRFVMGASGATQNLVDAQNRAMLAVKPWRKFRPPTGPTSPAQNTPATGSGPEQLVDARRRRGRARRRTAARARCT